MITFDFSNATDAPCRAADLPETGYATCYTSTYGHDDGGRLTVGVWEPRQSANRRRVRTGQEVERLPNRPVFTPLRGITETRENSKVIQPSRRVFSVPGNGALTTEDTPNRTLIVIPGSIRLPRSTHCDGPLTQGCGLTFGARTLARYIASQPDSPSVGDITKAYGERWIPQISRALRELQNTGHATMDADYAVNLTPAGRSL